MLMSIGVPRSSNRCIQSLRVAVPFRMLWVYEFQFTCISIGFSKGKEPCPGGTLLSE